MPLIFSRNGKLMQTEITPVVKENDLVSLGMYIKDKVLGIGTLTYVIPETNQYGALGHSIDANNSKKGAIYNASVYEVLKGSSGNIGEKRAKIESEEIGYIDQNEDTGIYGALTSTDSLGELFQYKIGKRDTVKKGKAYILTTLDNNKIDRFEIEIVDLEHQNQSKIKGIKFKVTDTRLLEKTGGIISGMSGSPIIQDEHLIGAVTHVVIHDPKEGYGVYIEWMLNEMDINVE